MKILITGANGMVARAAAAHCRAIGDEVFALTRQELDISEPDPARTLVSDIRPDAILNCAAYTNVDGAESEPEMARAANVTGVENLAAAAKEFDSRYVTISTDYVFDGAKAGFYDQRDTPAPQGVYAATKREGEIAAFRANGRSVIVRSGWIFGTGGTNFLSVMSQLLADGKRIKAIGDSYGTPTFAGDLAARLRELAELDLPGVFHVTNAGEGTSYLGFAEKVCEISGCDQQLVEAISKDDLRRPAPRPVNSRLRCLLSGPLGLAAMPEWNRSLEKYLSSATS